MLKLYRFYEDFGRHGEIEGLFIEESDFVDKLVKMGVSVTYYDVLGKHSEVTITFDKDTFAVVLDDSGVIDILVKHVGNSLSGINTVDKYVEDLEETCDYDSNAKIIFDELKGLGFI